MNETRDFLRTVHAPYFDAFYFVDEMPLSKSLIFPHLFFKLIFYIEGDIYYTIQDQRFDPLSGDILIAPRFTPYRSFSPNGKPYRRIVIWFTQELLDSVDPSGNLRTFYEQFDSPNSGVLFRFHNSCQSEIFKQAHLLASERDYSKPMSDAVSHSLAALILIEIYRAATTSSMKRSEEKSAAELVQAVEQYINENLSKTLSLDSIADKFFISKFHLERIFKKKTGVTVHNYIVQRRLTLARQKLYSGKSPTNIYKSCGFANYSTFYRAFQKMYHITPKDFADQAASILFSEGNRSWNAWGSQDLPK